MRLRFILLAGLFAIAGCATVAPPQAENLVPAVAPDELRDDPYYQLLVGELAGQHGRFSESVAAYRGLMAQADDVAVTARALQIASYADDPELGRIAAERWAQLAPEDVKARLAAGVWSLLDGKVDAAVVHLYQYLAFTPGGPALGFRQLGAALGQEKLPSAEALEVMRQLTAKHPEVASGHLATAILAARLGNLDEAEQRAQQAVVLDPRLREARIFHAQVLVQQERAEEGFAELEQVLAERPGDERLRIAYARLLLQSELVDRARAQYEILLSQQPNHDEALFALGIIAMDSEDYAAAEQYFQRNVRDGARKDDAAFQLGAIAEEQERYVDALQWYRQVEDGDRLFDAQYRVAFVLGKLDKIDEARSWFARLREQYPEQQARFYQGEGDLLFTLQRFQQAFDAYSTGLRTAPEDTGLLYGRSLAAEKLGRIDQVEADLRRVLALRPDDAMALNALGYTLANATDRHDEAHGYIERALRLEPEDPAILDSMGWVLYRQGKLQESLRFLKRAYDQLKDPEVAAHYGELLWVLGRREAAEAVWQRALADSDGANGEVVRETRQRLAE